MIKQNFLSDHHIRPEAEAIIEHTIGLFYEQFRAKPLAPLEEDTIRAIRRADLMLLEMHAAWNAAKGKHEDLARGLKTIEHLKKVYRI